MRIDFGYELIESNVDHRTGSEAEENAKVMCPTSYNNKSATAAPPRIRQGQKARLSQTY
jgi:hypothetical protein